jgi:hypothetical protein
MTPYLGIGGEALPSGGCESKIVSFVSSMSHPA